MAKNNVLCMREEELQSAASGFDKCSTSLGSAGASMAGKFSGATNSGLMGKAVSSISKEMSLISASIANMKGIVTKHSNQMFNYDRTMAKMANDIDIPTDFLANNSMAVNEYNRTLLGKIDGRSVNEGEAPQGYNEIEDSKVAAENLVNISGNQTELQHYDESSVIGRSVLGNIVKEGTEAKEYDNKVSVQKSDLNDISGNQTEAQEYDESSVIGKSVLGSLKVDGDTSQKELNSNTGIASANLSSMDKSVNATNTNITEDMMMQTQGMAAASLASLSASEQTKSENKKIEEAIERVDAKYKEGFDTEIEKPEDDKKDHQ